MSQVPFRVQLTLQPPFMMRSLFWPSATTLDGPQVPLCRPPDCRLAALLDLHVPECPMIPPPSLVPGVILPTRCRRRKMTTAPPERTTAIRQGHRDAPALRGSIASRAWG